MTRGSASGKVILCGEHAVVYGIPALALGIDRGARAEAARRADVDAATTLLVRGWNLLVSERDDVPVGRALHGLLGEIRARWPVPALSIEAETDLPAGGGLGCSAALGVAVARAVDPDADDSTVAQRVNAWERVFHGNPSGVDAAVAAQGGCVLFQKKDGVAHIERVRVPRVLTFCIGHSGQASSTKSMVEAVARIRERRPDTTENTFRAIETLVRNAKLAVDAGDLRALGQLLDLNQMLLASLFVSTPEIEQLCGAARAAGALGAKLTGAGGGGCVVALVEDTRAADAVLAAWKSDGFEGFATTVGSRTSARASSRLVGEAP